MTQTKTQKPKTRFTGARVVLIVTGAITSLLAVGLIGLA